MKSILTALLLASVIPAFAAETLVIDGVHNCCKSCENGIRKAVESVKGATLASSTKTSATVEVKGKSDARKVMEALMDAGYYGTIQGASETSSTSASAAMPEKLTSATVTGVHLCCGKCVTAAKNALADVPGITENTIANKAKSFTVKGTFTAAELTAALNKQGLHGKVKKS